MVSKEKSDKEALIELIKKTDLPEKGKNQLVELVKRKKAKAKIDFDTLTELDKRKTEVNLLIKKLKKTGLQLKTEIKGKSFVVYLLYQPFEIKERLPIGVKKPPQKEWVRPETKLKKIYLKTKHKLARMKDKPAFKLFNGSFGFYIHLREKFMDKLKEIYPEHDKFQRILDIILKQALEAKSKKELNELYKGSLYQASDEREKEFRKNILTTSRKELGFRLKTRENKFSDENIKKTLKEFEEYFLNPLSKTYGRKEAFMMAVVECLDKVSDMQTFKEAHLFLKKEIPKIIKNAKKSKNPLIEIKNKIEVSGSGL